MPLTRKKLPLILITELPGVVTVSPQTKVPLNRINFLSIGGDEEV
jgi:hypothetical protein